MRRPAFWLLSVIVALAAYVRFRALSFGLPFTQARPDETFIIDAARAMLSGRSPQFFDYPWLYIGTVALGDVAYFVWGWFAGWFGSISDMVASWPTHWTPFFLIPRTLSAISGTLTVVLVYRLGRQVRDEATGLVAALFLAFAFIHARDSHFGTTDAMMTLFIVAAVSALVDADRSQRPSRYGVAGVLAGLASATKYNAVILAVPMAIVWILRVSDTRPRPLAALRDVRLGYLVLGFVAAFGVGIPFVVIDNEAFMVAMRNLAGSMRVGDPRLELQNGWLHHLQLSLRYGLGVPMLITALAGVPLMLRVTPRVGAIVLSFPVAYYVVAGSIRNLFFRYTIPVVPFLCLTAAFLLCWAVARVRARWTSESGPLPLSWQAVTALVALGLVAPGAARVMELDRVLAATDNRVVIANWFEQNVPPRSSLVQSGSRFGHARFGLNMAYKEWRWTGRGFTVDGAPATGKPEWILLQESPLPSATQDVITEYLREGYVRVAKFKATTLDPDIVYDRQDAFFVPFNGLNRIRRPGPNFTLYKRLGGSLGGSAAGQ